MGIFNRPAVSAEQNMIARVGFADASGFGVVGASQITGALIFAPRGISYRPMPGDHLLLLPAGGADLCVGSLSQTAGLLPGELRLTSGGGAVIHLRANGDISLNGVTITRNGQILSN